MYAITGGTGKVGKVLVNELLTKGKKVRAIARDTSKLREISSKGATPLSGDLNDAEFVKSAFINAEGVVCIIPENPQSNDFRAESRRITKNYIDSVRDNNIKYVILLSSIGAQLGNQAGIDESAYELERQFSELKNVNVLNLRSAFHMENLLSQIELISHTGTMSSPLKSNLSFATVCTDDVGMYASKRLIESNFRGITNEYILGQRDITPNEMASIIGRAIGKPQLKYTQLQQIEFMSVFKQIGFSDNVSLGIYQWAQNLNEGKLSGYYQRTPQNTTQTTFEQFAKTFAEEYKMHEVTA